MRDVKSQKVHVTHSHVPRTIVVKLFNKISLVCVTVILPFRILFRSYGIQFLPAQVRSKGGRGLEVHVPTGTPATSVLRQHYVAQSPVLVLRAVWGSRGRGGPYNRVRVSRQSARCIVSPLWLPWSRRKRSDCSRPIRGHGAVLRHMALPNYDRLAFRPFI